MKSWFASSDWRFLPARRWPMGRVIRISPEALAARAELGSMQGCDRSDWIRQQVEQGLEASLPRYEANRVLSLWRKTLQILRVLFLLVALVLLAACPPSHIAPLKICLCLVALSGILAAAERPLASGLAFAHKTLRKKIPFSLKKSMPKQNMAHANSNMPNPCQDGVTAP